MLKKYKIQPGFSLTTIKGIAHAGAIVTADHFSDPEAASKYLEELKDKGKVKLVEQVKPAESAEASKPGEPTKPEEASKQEELTKNKPFFGSGGAKKKE